MEYHLLATEKIHKNCFKNINQILELQKILHQVAKFSMLDENHGEQILAICKSNCCYMNQDNLEIELFSWTCLVHFHML